MADDESEFPAFEIEQDGAPIQKAVVENIELSVRKRKFKLIAKGLMAKLDILQKQRKSKFDKASQLKKTIQELMSNRENENEVKGMFEKFETQCKEAKCLKSLKHNAKKQKKHTSL